MHERKKPYLYPSAGRDPRIWVVTKFPTWAPSEEDPSSKRRLFRDQSSLAIGIALEEGIPLRESYTTVTSRSTISAASRRSTGAGGDCRSLGLDGFAVSNRIMIVIAYQEFIALPKPSQWSPSSGQLLSNNKSAILSPSVSSHLGSGYIRISCAAGKSELGSIMWMESGLFVGGRSSSFTSCKFGYHYGLQISRNLSRYSTSQGCISFLLDWFCS
ncbi:uncharacterized protein LOC130015413 [Mercurialis annua]|uniref:uncharacterized protein LOC130015413 n=1 Tax=Mercurialis annua TaxID=3986 RepID=UPI0024AE8FBC|nr:uncharacterized protein LOC130015413 [Mercurialis annua]